MLLMILRAKNAKPLSLYDVIMLKILLRDGTWCLCDDLATLMYYESLQVNLLILKVIWTYVLERNYLYITKRC